MQKLLTRWGKTLDKTRPLDEYPRPQLRRDSFFCLNGVWDYAIYKKNRPFMGYQGDITVPFSPETILSGVQRTVTPEDELFYRRYFHWEKKEGARVLLHFGAVDYECAVCLNDRVLGSHTGGYTPFTFDVTDALTDGENALTLRVTDPSETGSGARGKQTSRRGNIWYTPQSGIWQTVWMEEVPQTYIASLRLTPDIDRGTLRIEVNADGGFSPVTARVHTADGPLCEVNAEQPVFTVPVPDARLWSPEDPFLYGLTLTMGEDTVESYFGMRKFSVGKDEKGFSRIFLNNKPYFMNGLLDQGYWSDGLYTAPSDEALIYDIETMKDMGFNMLRKHIKIEPLRWYYHCDRLGMLVWQDMINGGAPVNQAVVAAFPGVGLALGTKKAGVLNDGPINYKRFSREDAKGREEYYTDAGAMIDTLYNCVSLCLWVPFNEGWGQFDAKKACEFFRTKDPTRLIDHASGWHDQGAGDINSFHIYFTPFFFPKYDKNDDRVIALTEFGGYSMQTEGHVFNTEKFFGYRKYKTRQALSAAIKTLYLKRLKPLIRSKGLSALVYTEVSDVEDETNGFLTFDRAVTKVDPDFMRGINEQMKL